ncbi:hypothetical protein QCA50_016686 [Cerrena zonata]|uniref:Secreted protein n=1 Tax=Cerrena zonata TaxID=2478898 RepID=A0AAW0FLI4_9APHY
MHLLTSLVLTLPLIGRGTRVNRSMGLALSRFPMCCELVLLYRKDARQLHVWPTSHNQTEIGLLMAELVAVGNELTRLMQKEKGHEITTHISVCSTLQPPTHF